MFRSRRDVDEATGRLMVERKDLKSHLNVGSLQLLRPCDLKCIDADDPSPIPSSQEINGRDDGKFYPLPHMNAFNRAWYVYI